MNTPEQPPLPPGRRWRPIPPFQGITAAAFLALALGCGAESDAPAPSGETLHVAPDRPLGAVVFLLDTVRSDHLSCYGYPRPTTPSIDALARNGALFEKVASYSTWTLPSVTAVLAADYPPLVFDDELRMTRSVVEALSAAGYRTAAFTEGGYVSRRWGMNRGFDVFSDGSGNGEAANGIEATFRAARDWLAENANAPFFLLIHTYEAHMPYTNRDFAQLLEPGRVGPSYEFDLLDRVRSGEVSLTEAEREYIRALYDGDIHSADRHVGAFLRFLDEIDLSDRTVVVVTSDHGEEMGDEFELFIGGHGHSMRDNLLLVPLVIHDPTRDFARKRIDTQVRTIDILPTVAELMGAAIESPINGRSLVPILMGHEAAHRTAMSGETNRGFARISIRDGRHKYIRAVDPAAVDVDVRLGLVVPPRQLYDLVDDPSEDRNLIGARPRLARTLDRALGSWFNGLSRTPIDPTGKAGDEKLLERLRALGYVD